MIIFSPGPANISERVRSALAMPDIGHRESEFTEILLEPRSLLLQICGVPNEYSCAVLSGSITAKGGQCRRRISGEFLPYRPRPIDNQSPNSSDDSFTASEK